MFGKKELRRCTEYTIKKLTNCGERSLSLQKILNCNESQKKPTKSATSILNIETIRYANNCTFFFENFEGERHCLGEDGVFTHIVGGGVGRGGRGNAAQAFKS